MRLNRLGLLVLAAVAPRIARADISDSGKLTIGGLGIFVGTVTVQGNAFSVGGSTLAVSNGRVGVGTTSPAYGLDVSGTGRFTGQFYTAPGLGIALNGVTEGVYASGSNTYLFANNGYVNMQNVYATSGGNVGIGTASPGYMLDVASAAHVTSLTYSSDARLKENVRPLQSVLSKISRIRGVGFDWNDRYKKMGRATGGRQIGVLADEVEKEFPELVTNWLSPEYADGRLKGLNIRGKEDKPVKWTEYRSMDYGRFTAVLLEAIKEQQNQIKEQQKQLEVLAEQVRALRER